MTKEEQNQIIKDAWVRNLQKKVDIPEDIGNIYKNWLLGKIKQASQQMMQAQQQSQGQEQSQGGQEAAPEQQSA